MGDISCTRERSKRSSPTWAVRVGLGRCIAADVAWQGALRTLRDRPVPHGRSDPALTADVMLSE